MNIKPFDRTFDDLAIKLGLEKAYIVSKLANAQETKPRVYFEFREIEKDFPFWEIKESEKHLRELNQRGIITIFEDGTKTKSYMLNVQGVEKIITASPESQKLKSKYARDIYEMVRDVAGENLRNNNDVTMSKNIEMDKLRDKTRTKSKYKRLSSFKVKVLDIAIKEINQKTDFHVTVKPYTVKGSKACAGFKFEITNHDQEHKSNISHILQTSNPHG